MLKTHKRIIWRIGIYVSFYILGELALSSEPGFSTWLQQYPAFTFGLSCAALIAAYLLEDFSRFVSWLLDKLIPSRTRG